MAWTDAQSRLAALFIVMMILPTIAVFIRLWATCVARSRRFGMDDAFAVAPLVCLTVTLCLASHAR